MNTPPQQPPLPPANPPVPAPRGTYRTMLIIGAFFLVVAIALLVYSEEMFRSDMADGQGNGGAEASGFVFMAALFPGVIGAAFFVWGLVAASRERAWHRR